jgi:hypothetical protein
MKISGMDQREPTLEDARDKSETNARNMRMLLSKIRDIHHILDKDIQGGRTEEAIKGTVADKAPIPNLRFDLNNFAKEIGDNITSANQELTLLESKLRNTHPKEAQS